MGGVAPLPSNFSKAFRLDYTGKLPSFYAPKKAQKKVSENNQE